MKAFVGHSEVKPAALEQKEGTVTEVAEGFTSSRLLKLRCDFACTQANNLELEVLEQAC
jgi:hypothetical protein